MDKTIYSNGYQCTLDTKGNEIVINFLLTIPALDENGEMKVKTSTAVNVVMSREKVEELRDSLTEVLQRFEESKADH